MEQKKVLTHGKKYGLIFLLCPYLLFSGEFTANVDRHQIDIGESFVLNLTLKEASAKKAPTLDRLQKEFSIHSQQQNFSTVIINNKITTTTNWKLTLFPTREGDVTIPAINIDTSEGVLTSNPVTIQVVKTTGSSTLDALENVVVKSKVSKKNPYKNEPFIYEIEIFSKKDLVDIQVEKFDLENAIMENHGEPQAYRKTIEGINVNVVHFSFLITPLKSGPLNIPATIAKGAVSLNPLSQARAFLNDNPFGLIQKFTQFNLLP